MRYSSRLTVAAHILMCIGYFQGKEKLTSDFLAGSVNVNPVVIRNTLGKLKKAGILPAAASAVLLLVFTVAVPKLAGIPDGQIRELLPAPKGFYEDKSIPKEGQRKKLKRWPKKKKNKDLELIHLI